MEYDIHPEQLTITETHEDPDGADRGGYHQETHTLTVAEDTLTVEREISDYYEDRMGGTPQPFVSDKEDAIAEVVFIIENHEKKLVILQQLLANIAKTIKFVGVED